MAAVRRPLRLASRVPLTVALGGVLAALMAASAVAGSTHRDLVDALGVTWPDLAHGRLWRLPTSSLVQEDAGIVWPIVALLPALPVAEARMGPARTLLTWVAADAAATVLALAALEAAGDRLATAPNIGSSAGLLGVLAAWTMLLPERHRRRAVAALGAGLALALVVDPELAAVQHVIAAVVGGLLGHRLRSSPTHLRRRSCAA
jgi:membrane associated rhomboid family serine protease